MAASTYKQAFRSFRAHAKGNSLAIAQDVAVALAEKVILLTPVDTTRAEANWISALNTIPQEFDEAKRNLGGQRANIDQAKATAKKINLGDAFVVANSTPYIIYLEQGSSRQAPAGMRDVTAASFPRIVEAALRRRQKS